MDKSSSNRTAVLRMTFAMLLSGSIGFLVVESGEDAATVVFFRCMFGAIALLSFLVLRRCVKMANVTARSWGLMALSGVTMAANWVFFFRAYEYAPISTVTVVYHLYPFLLIAAAALFFGERIRMISIIWAVIAFLGVGVLAGSSTGSDSINLIGSLITLVSMSFYAATLLIAKRLATVPPELTSAVQLCVGAIVLLPFQSVTTSAFQPTTLGILLTLGVVHTGLLYVLLYGAVQKLDMASVALLSFLYPATALFFDVLVYDVRPGPFQLIGFAMILFAVTAERMGLYALRELIRSGKID